MKAQKGMAITAQAQIPADPAAAQKDHHRHQAVGFEEVGQVQFAEAITESIFQFLLSDRSDSRRFINFLRLGVSEKAKAWRR